MKCPFCRSSDTEVYNTRSTKLSSQVWRRRRCQSCQQTFTTYEAADLGFLSVIGKDSKPAKYNRARLFASIYVAFLGGYSVDDDIDAITETIESKLLDLKKQHISTDEISRNVLSTLKHFNTPAFVRYLSARSPRLSPAQLSKEMRKY